MAAPCSAAALAAAALASCKSDEEIQGKLTKCSLLSKAEKTAALAPSPATSASLAGVSSRLPATMLMAAPSPLAPILRASVVEDDEEELPRKTPHAATQSVGEDSLE
jgi:hypothetical protein